MKRFYLAVPVEYEEATLRKIVQLGAVQLTRDIPLESTEKSESVEVCKEFVRQYERLNFILTDVEIEKAKEEKVEEKLETDFGLIKSLVDRAGTKLDDSTMAMERLESEIKNLGVVRERLDFLNENGLRIDDIGKFPHVFVKAGFIKNTMLPRLSAYVGGTSLVSISRPGRSRENFVVVTGLNEDEPLMELVLKLLNFEEFVFPQV